MALLRLCKIADALKRELEGGGIDVERGDLPAQQRIGEHTVLGADSIGGDLAERTPGAQADAADHLALMREQIFGDIPALVELADEIALRHAHSVEEGLA